MEKALSLGVGVPEDFVPATAMERAFVQARLWAADRAWKRAYTEMAEGQLAIGVGIYLCLLDYYARRDGIRELFETCEWILARLASLHPSDRLSVCKVVCCIVKSLKEDEFDIKEARLKLILRIPLAVILDAVAEQRLSCALTGLLEFSRVFEESVTLKQCSDIEGDFLGVALAIDRSIRAGTVRDKVKASEETRAEYDKQRQAGINMADAQRDRLEKETVARALVREFEDDLKRKKSQESVLWTQSSEKPFGSSDDVEHEPSAIPPTVDPSLPLLPPGELPTLKQDSAVSKSHSNPGHQTRKYLEKADPAKENLGAAQKPFSPKTSQVAQSLASLIYVGLEDFAPLDSELSLENLQEQIGDRQSGHFSNLILYRILAAIGRSNERISHLATLAVIENAYLTGWEEPMGLSLCFGIVLWRLTSIWCQADSLLEGRAYLDILRNKLALTKSLEDPFVGQLSSAIQFISRLIVSKQSEKFEGASVEQQSIGESAEYAAMLSVLAIDNLQKGRIESVQIVLNEFLGFYSRAVGSICYWAGEMLWLTQETSLSRVKGCTLALIRQSQSAAYDRNLSDRVGVHVRRLLDRVEDFDYANEILAQLIISKRDGNAYESYQDRLFQVKRFLSWRFYPRDFEEESSEELKRTQAAEKEKRRKNNDSQAVLRKLKKLAEDKDWSKFVKAWRKGSDRLSIDDSVSRLGQIGVLALRSEQIEICLGIIDLLHDRVSYSCMHVFNYLCELCAHWLSQRKDYGQASALLEKALSDKHQLGDFSNCLRLQLAEVYVAQGRFFEATVLIYEAYSNIPDSECGGAQQILMSY